MMDRPLALPNDLLDKAAEVRADEGPLRIRQLLEDVEGLSKQDMALLNEVGCIVVASMATDTGQAFDTLDQEVEEDESYRKRFGSKWAREPSHMANEDLTNKARHFSTVLQQAMETDRTVKEKWRQWRGAIETLASDEVIPSYGG
jgi:programmed cell death 6-interacting protein